MIKCITTPTIVRPSSYIRFIPPLHQISPPHLHDSLPPSPQYFQCPSLLPLQNSLLRPSYSTTLLVPIRKSTNPSFSSVSTLGLFGMTTCARGGVYLRSLLIIQTSNQIVSRIRTTLFLSQLTQEISYFDSPSIDSPPMHN